MIATSSLSLNKYLNWLHLKWPAGKVEKLPKVNSDGSTDLPGVFIVGDLSGVPLLKFSSHTGAIAVNKVAERLKKNQTDNLDLIIIGGGVSGMSAAIQAKKLNLNFKIFEAAEVFSTIVNFPKGKPIYTYPSDMIPTGDLQFSTETNTKEKLLEALKSQVSSLKIYPEIAKADKIEKMRIGYKIHFSNGLIVSANNVIIAIGRSGNFRKLGVKGENLPKVYNRLHDPKEFTGKNITVVGGGDSALETAIAIAEANGVVTISYRNPEFNRPKPENIQKINDYSNSGKIKVLMNTTISEITDKSVIFKIPTGEVQNIPNDIVFSMIGREPPLDFFRKSGIEITGDWNIKKYLSFIIFFSFCIFLYHWKEKANPFEWAANPQNIFGAIVNAAKDPSFYYSLAYSLCVLIFGIKRIKRRKTPYVTKQTICLIVVQWIPLFILPYMVLPWMHANHYFETGALHWIHDQFFPGDSYWRSFGFILAWPLFIYNVFTDAPIMAWLILSLIQTFVIIPIIVYYWGKGAYCGWICSCGALAETLGDTQRQKMPHGRIWNQLNIIGQVILWLCMSLLFLRIISWIFPASGLNSFFNQHVVNNYKYFIDIWLAGIVGVGFYFFYSGRVWCRFACPLAALMHIYARFSKFRIFSEKKKCISCNVCTTVCHQGIDIMSFANKGLPMEDPECVRCSACVQSCPTGVLSFGQINQDTGEIFSLDSLPASPVQMAEKKPKG
jgi:thioredoxin reductase/polyferredoxin